MLDYQNNESLTDYVSNAQESSFIESMHNDSDSFHSNTTILHTYDISANSSMGSVDNTILHNSVQERAYDTNNLGLRGKGLRIGHLNIQGINNKIDQLKIMLQSNFNKIHMLGLSETKLSDHHAESVFEINGYQKPFRKDRNSNGGGLIVYVKNGISCVRRHDLELDTLECIWVEITPTNSKSFLVAHVYRPPSSTAQWNELFEDSLEKAFNQDLEMYLLGDFNRDLLNDQVKMYG